MKTSYRKSLELQLSKERRRYLISDCAYEKRYVLSAMYKLMKLLGYSSVSIKENVAS